MTSPKATYPDLAKRTVFISGGATGIGQSLVTGFAAQGAKVAFVDIEKSAGETLAKTLNDQGHTVTFIDCDITETTAYQAVIEQAAVELGPITVLVNNAANDVRHTLASLTPDRFDELASVNIKHQLFAAQTVVPMMQKAGGGSIINFGSISWMIPVGGMPAYTAAKAAAHGLTRGLARDFGGDHIRVNTIVPGWVMTEKQVTTWVDAEARALIDQSQCLKGEVMPDDITQMALFLASDAAAMCSAQNFVVDGGWV